MGYLDVALNIGDISPPPADEPDTEIDAALTRPVVPPTAQPTGESAPSDTGANASDTLARMAAAHPGAGSVAAATTPSPLTRPKSPYALTAAAFAFLQGGGDTTGQTQRVHLQGDIPLNNSGSSTLRLLASQDRRDAAGSVPSNYLTRGYASLQLRLLSGPKLSFGANVGGGFETLENPKNNDPQLSRYSTAAVFTTGANARFQVNDKVTLGVNASSLSIRTADGVGWFRAGATPSVTYAIGPVDVAFGALVQTDQLSSKPDSSFVAITPSLVYRNPVADVSLQTWINVAGHYVSPSVNALPLAGGQADAWKLMVGVSHRFTVARD